MSPFKTPVPHQPDFCIKAMGIGRERAVSASWFFGGIPLLGNFPRLLKNRSRAFITILSVIIHALNCLSLAPYLSSKFQEEALGGTQNNLSFSLPLCQFCSSSQNYHDARRSHQYKTRCFWGSAAWSTVPKCHGISAPHPG